MKAEIIQALHDYWLEKLTREQLMTILEKEIGTDKAALDKLFETIIATEDAPGVDYGLSIIHELDLSSAMLDTLHRLILAPWHYRYEDLIHTLQKLKHPASVPIIKAAMQKRYDYLESYGTGTQQFISQCGYALVSIGTDEALAVIKELAQSNDPILQAEMLNHL